MNKKLLEKNCNGYHEQVEKNIDNQIENLNKMKILSKVVSFASCFERYLATDGGENDIGDLRKHYGKKITLSFGYETNRYPQSSSVFYTLYGRKSSFSIEDSPEFLELLRLADEGERRFSNEMVIDHAFAGRLIGLIMGKQIMEKYFETREEMHIMF